jgi:hypothetical protein
VAPVGESSDNAVSGDNQIVHGRLDVGKRGEEGRPPSPVGFTSICHERVVVDVVDSHKAIDGIGIVVVQALQVAPGKRSPIRLAVCHRDPPIRLLDGRPPTFAGACPTIVA